MLRHSETVWETVNLKLWSLPFVLGTRIPSPGLRLRPYRKRIRITCLTACVVLFFVWLVRSLETTPAAPQLTYGHVGIEDHEVPPVADVPVAEALPDKLQQRLQSPAERFCAQLERHTQDCGAVDRTNDGICLYTVTSGPTYLRHPTHTHRTDPVVVEEQDPRCSKPRKTTRYRRVSVIYRNWDDVPSHATLEDAFCLQRLMDELYNAPMSRCPP